MAIVMKFGGTSVGSAEAIRRSAGVVRAAHETGAHPLVVVSALSGTTDALLHLARKALSGEPADVSPLRTRHVEVAGALGLEIPGWNALFSELSDILRGIALIGELTPRTLDLVASFGERLSAPLFATALDSLGCNARPLMSFEAGLLTDDRFGNARPLPGAAEALRAALHPAPEVPVVTGYLGRDPEGRITTLGRGGSDYSASIVGAALGVEEIQIWTDVNGVMTADPRIVPNARIIDVLSFEEASELAYYGAKVLHPSTLLPAMEADIPVRVKNSFHPDAPGTLIVAKRTGIVPGRVRAIASMSGVHLINMVTSHMLGQPGFIAEMGALFHRHGLDINMIATSEVSVSCTVQDPKNLALALGELRRMAQVTAEPDRAIICVVGEGLRDAVGVAGRIFQAVARAGVNVLLISQGATRINVGFVVAATQVATAVKALHAELIEASP